MIIPFGIEFAFYPGSNPVVNAKVLKASMLYLIAIDQIYLRDNPGTPELYQAGVVYGRTEIWDSIPDVIARSYGDCKSLTAWLIAERREQGLMCEPVFRFRELPNGQLQYHILVQTPDGFEDPSKFLGMGANENAAIVGAR